MSTILKGFERIDKRKNSTRSRDILDLKYRSAPPMQSHPSLKLRQPVGASGKIRTWRKLEYVFETAPYTTATPVKAQNFSIIVRVSGQLGPT